MRRFDGPDRNGHFGPFGGRYVPETLMSALIELDEAYRQARVDPAFQRELAGLLRDYSGRPTPLYHAARLTEAWGGAKVFLKREDLNHTGAHKINNCLGQVLLAKWMGKKRIIAETGAGQHGVASATVAALYGMECEVYMGEHDMKRQALNVFRMNLLGARVIPVRSGSGTLKDATNEAIRQWVTRVEDSHYIIGSVVGPHPYPQMVRDFQRVIGDEVLEQIGAWGHEVPDYLVACVGGGSNSIGLFYPMLEDERIRMFGVEAAGRGIESGEHAASLGAGRPGVLHGSYSYILQTDEGQVIPAHSVSAGLDYPGSGPEHSYLKETGRVEYVSVTDDEALEAFQELSRLEGIIPALESAHALHYAKSLAARTGPEEAIVVCLSGRGDKDVAQVQDMLKGSETLEQNG